MSDFVDLRLEPGLWLLADWSLRWGVLIVVLWIGLALRPPRQAALRLAVCQLVLVAGLALPLIPRWWGHELMPARAVAIVDAVRFEQPMSVARDPALRPSIAELKPVTGTGPSRSTALAKHGIPETAEPESILTTPATRPEPLGAFRIVLLCTAGLWLAGLCVQLTRLISGVFCLSRLPRAPVPQASNQRNCSIVAARKWACDERCNWAFTRRWVHRSLSADGVLGSSCRSIGSSSAPRDSEPCCGTN